MLQKEACFWGKIGGKCHVICFTFHCDFGLEHRSQAISLGTCGPTQMWEKATHLGADTCQGPSQHVLLGSPHCVCSTVLGDRLKSTEQPLRPCWGCPASPIHCAYETCWFAKRPYSHASVLTILRNKVGPEHSKAVRPHPPSTDGRAVGVLGSCRDP